MSSQILDKRTRDSRLYTIDCSRLLDAAETISSVEGVTADAGGCTFSQIQVIAAPLTLDDGTVVAAGKGIQFVISGGSIPDGRPWLKTPVRPILVTTVNAALEATVTLRLIDDPPT